MGSKKFLILLAFMQVGYILGQNSIPQFTNTSALNDNYLFEDFPIGGVVGTIKAFDPDNRNGLISYYLEGAGAEYFEIGRNDGVVKLKKILEFDTFAVEREIKTTIRVVDEQQQENTFQGKVFIKDVNDIPPKFDRTDIFATLNEDAMPPLLVATISVTDEDTTNSILSVECRGTNELLTDACDKFEVKFSPADITNKNWVGEVRLAKRLDYESRISYAILLIAKDGVFETKNEVHIEVKDINDSPPIWTRVLPMTINEEWPIGTTITTVTARDGDATNPRAISYDIIDTVYPDDASFIINNITGEITNDVRLDYDNPLHKKGSPYEIIIRAREIISTSPLQVGNDAITTSTTVISITIQDIDDNTPSFNKKSYSAIIPENVVNGGNIPGLQMTITDIDSGTYNSFDLVSLDFQDMFGIVPNKGQANAGATLFIKDSTNIDFESGVTEYVIRLEARENLVTPALTGRATVTVTVQNINDQTPKFTNPLQDDTLFRTIYETAAENDVVVTLNAQDDEAGDFGTAGIRYKLFGNQGNHFQIDEKTGVISVAKCNPPGKPGLYPCIDYERKKQYVLTASATDDLGNGRSKSIQIIVTVRDENDNIPKPKTRYTASIYEDETIPVSPLIIKAEDPDTVGNDLVYTLKGDANIIKNWVITNAEDSDGDRIGIITARTPVKFSWAQDLNLGTVNFQVQMTDQKDTVISDVTIFIIDINNNAPIFSDSVYEVSIKEDTTGDVLIETVTASDGDAPTTGNGILDFTIASGGLGKFTVRSVVRLSDSYEAKIYTNPDATFNYDQVKKFTMTLVARDQGSPETKSGTTTLIVNILDINNNDPEITPTSVSISVAEDRPKDSQVHKVIAIDPDNTATLKYYMQPTRAQNPSGAIVDKTVFDYTQLFRIEEDTGIVRVNGPLNRESTSFIVNELTVIDVAATPQQVGTGALFITITEVNDQDPKFDSDFYNITINEELNVNFFVRNLHCTDEDDQISRYLLTQTQPRTSNYFTLLDNSGSLIVADRIDYEKLEEIRLTATCFDDGTPQRFGTADVLVNIQNLNDNSPEFLEQVYRAQINETEEGEDIGGKMITVVSATDIDKGDFGIVRYMMADSKDPFNIDSVTGRITVKAGTKFDRESSSSVSFQVIAYDSPNTPDKRKQTSVPVYLTINDLNDNCPVFTSSEYTGTILESALPGTDITDTLARDDDFGINKQISYSLQPGSYEPAEGDGYFSIGLKSGRVYSLKRFNGMSGNFKFNITATDGGGCSTHAPATIKVSSSTNYAPHWTDPPQRDWVIYVLESQYEGMLVYNAHADDPDDGRSGIVDYSFIVDSKKLQTTGDFRINKVTGMIRAEIEFDREQVDRYFLTLVASDQGATSSSSETTLIVVILDVDDNDPIFENKNGVVIPRTLPETFDLFEDRIIDPVGLVVGQCSATDADSDHENNRIYYEILSENEALHELVKVDPDDCTIRLMKTIDADVIPQIEFNIYAFNKKNDDTVKRNKRSTNLSILPVVIKINDANDNAPVFSQSEYFACTPLTAPFRSSIVDLDAHDVEQKDLELEYSLSTNGDNRDNIFVINSQGIVQNNVDFPTIDQRVFALEGQVTDRQNIATVDVNVFVTSTATQVMITVNRPSTDVKRVKLEYENTIKGKITGASYVCSDVLNHINEDGTVSSSQSDIYLSVITKDSNGVYSFMSGSVVQNLLSTDRSSEPAAYDEYFITDVSIVEEDQFGLDEGVVLAILIITIILIVLALILMALACYCIWAKTKKKKRHVKAQHRTVLVAAGDSGQEEAFSNPVYNNAGYVAYEDEYSTVSKTKKDMGSIAPVVIPAPENLQPLSTFGPTNLEPAYDDDNAIPPEIPEPVIETEVMPEEEPPYPVKQMQPEYEDEDDVIETTVQDDEPEFPAPPELDADEIETEIRDDTPPPSPRE